MIFYIDIDDTICTRDPKTNTNYNCSTPLKDRIITFNKLYDEGHHLVYWTARGTVTGIDWTYLTECQLNDWGVQYHELKMNKPYYDVFIDDKSFNSFEDYINYANYANSDVKPVKEVSNHSSLHFEK